jgi:hypothetical protein
MNFPTTKPSMELTSSEAHRFWSKVDVATSDMCWQWTGYCLPFGYGQVWLQGKTVLSHRVAYSFAKGKVPPDLHVRHLCDNPCCCNPAHLALGSDQDNSDDKCRQGRQARGSGNGRSKLSEQEVLHIYKSSETQEKLASEFGIRPSMVSRIKNGVYWHWLTGATR